MTEPGDLPRQEDELHTAASSSILDKPLGGLRGRDALEAATDKRRRIEIPTLRSEKEAFGDRIIGQPEAVDTFARLLAKAKSSITSTEPGAFDAKFLAGPSGVGKTEIVETFAELLAGDSTARQRIIRINGGGHQKKEDVTRLQGVPPGYDGQYSPGLLSQKNLDANAIHYTDNSGKERSLVIIFVDEAEKAAPEVHKLFLDAIDKGRMDMSDNSTSNLNNAIIFYGSNIGNNEANEKRKALVDEGIANGEVQQVTRGIIEDAFRKAFPPEFQGRIRELVLFNNLEKEALRGIVSNRIQRVEQAFAAHGIQTQLELSQAAFEWLIENGYNPTEGARAMNKLIATTIQDPLQLAQDSIEEGLHRKIIEIDIDNDIDPINPADNPLAFYFNEGQQLDEREFATVRTQASVVRRPAPYNPPEIDEGMNENASNIQPRIAADLIATLRESGPAALKNRVSAYQIGRALPGLNYQEVVQQIPELGVIGIEAVTNLANSLSSDSVDTDRFSRFIIEIAQYRSTGILTTAELHKITSTVSGLEQYVGKQLMDSYAKSPTDEYPMSENYFIKIGIGTKEQWDTLVLSDNA